ncbi:MAG: Ig-like domain-containing protein [Bacteroidota bacterium]
MDTVPPKIVATYPEPNTVSFSDNKIILEFDKYVEEPSVEGSVFISPALEQLEFDWSGKKVEIRFAQKLRPATTYVLNVGTDVVDVRNRNRMDKAFNLAFSTGGSIDSGSISGRVYDEKPEGVMIFAYRRDSLSMKALDPSVEKPHYLTQTGKEGSFSLTHLSLGAYRVFAVRDEYKNLLYDAGIDQIGMYHTDVVLDSTRSSFGNVNFQLTKEDTTQPQLFSATALDRNHLLLRFSKPLDTKRFRSNAFSLVDTLNGEHLQTRDGFVDLQNPSSLVLVTSDQKPEAGYRVVGDSIFDTTGHPLSTKSNSATFGGVALPDSSAPRIITISVRDSARHVPFDVRIQISFDDVVKQQEIEKAFSLLDSSGVRVSGVFSWETHAAVSFVPRTELQSRAWYKLRLPLSAVIDLGGNRGKDSALVVNFETVDKNQFGSLEGEVVDETGSEAQSAIVAKAKTAHEGDRRVYDVRLLHAGKFQIPRIGEGSYTLSAFRDDDNNGKYSYGKPFPFQPSELFAFYPDTVKVRARWPVEGIVIRLK